MPGVVIIDTSLVKHVLSRAAPPVGQEPLYIFPRSQLLPLVPREDLQHECRDCNPGPD